MKLSNAVVGMLVQVKRDCRGHSNESLKQGLVGTVLEVRAGDETHQLKVKNPDISWGFAWVNPSDVRIHKPTKSFNVGDTVLAGALGAGWGAVDTAYAGLLCKIVSLHPREPDVVRISHPNVRAGTPYSSHTKWLTAAKPEPTEGTKRTEFTNLGMLRVGDYIVANDTDPHLQAGVAYRVVKENAMYPVVALHHSEKESWREGYHIIPRNVDKILREVVDAVPTPVRVATGR